MAVVHPRFGSPYRADLVVGIVVAAVSAVVDVRGAIGFSSFAVLLYYAIANASAWTLEPEGRRHRAMEPEGRRHRTLGCKVIPTIGLIGCLLLAFLLPVSSVLVGTGVVLVGALVYGVRRSR